MSSKPTKLEPADSQDVSLIVDGEAPPVQVLFYLYNENGRHYELVVSHGHRVIGSKNVLWLLSQPQILDKLHLSLEASVPDDMFQMYHHDRDEWLSLPEPRCPILIAPGRSLLWHRAGVTDMPCLDVVIRMTADHAHPIPGCTQLLSTPIRGLFSFKATNASPTLKGALDLISPTKVSVPHRAKTLRGIHPGRMATTGSRKPKALTAAGTVTTAASQLVLPSSSPPVQSSSPPAPSQVLRNVFGDDWKSRVTKDAATPTGSRISKRVRSASPDLQDTPSKHPKHALPPGPLGKRGGGPNAAISNGRSSKKAYRPPVDPKDVIDISEDVDDEVVEICRPRKGKEKVKAHIPIPPDTEIIEISD